MYLIFCKKLQTVMLKKAAEIKKYEKKIKCIYAHDNVKCTETEGLKFKIKCMPWFENWTAIMSKIKKETKR